MQMFNGATAGSRCAFARLGADSIWTSSLRGGSFAFFVGCDEVPSAERFSTEALERALERGAGTLKGIAEKGLGAIGGFAD